MNIFDEAYFARILTPRLYEYLHATKMFTLVYLISLFFTAYSSLIHIFNF